MNMNHRNLKKLRALKLIEPFLKSEKCFLVLSNLIPDKYFVIDIAYYREKFKINVLEAGSIKHINKLNSIVLRIIDYVVLFKRSYLAENDLNISNETKKPLFFFNNIMPKVFQYRDIFFKLNDSINLTFFNGQFYFNIDSSQYLFETVDKIKKLNELNVSKVYLVCYEENAENIKRKLSKVLNLQIDTSRDDLLKAVDIAIQATAILEGLFSASFILYVPRNYE